MHSPNRIEFANTLRGFAAISVVIAHYLGVFWTAPALVASLTNTVALPPEIYTIPQYISWLHKLGPYFQWGPFGVALFFLVSGFVIPFSLSRSTWIGFAANRIFRILPTYMTGFSICLLSIWIGGEYFSRQWPFSIKHVLIHYIPGLRAIASLPSIDSIVWTLEIEALFYFICALMILGFRHQSKKVFWVPFFLMLIDFLMAGLSHAFPYFWPKASVFLFVCPFIMFMFIGVVFHYLYKSLIEKEKGFLMIMGLFFGFTVSWKYAYRGMLPEIVWSYGLALCMFTFAYVYPKFFKSNRIFNFLADISYPLYTVHAVAGYVALRLLLDWGIKPWISLVIVSLGAIGVAWIIHRFIEKPLQISSSKFSLTFAARKPSLHSLLRGRASVSPP